MAAPHDDTLYGCIRQSNEQSTEENDIVVYPMVEECGWKLRKIKAIVTLDMEFPQYYTDDAILSLLNESSWCATNFLDLLNRISESRPGGGCICDLCNFELAEEEKQE